MQYVDSYRELLVHKPATLRDRLRKLTLDGVAAGYRLGHSYQALFRVPRVQFLYIHHVFADEEEKLDRLLQALSRDHIFISYSEAVQRIVQGKVDRAYISISSDDGLKNNLRAATILDKYGVSGCFFICPSLTGEKDFEKVKAFCATRLHFPPVELLDWPEVASLQSRGHEIGGHTLTHINIARANPVEMEEEIQGCHTVLVSRCGSVAHFAYPYGRFTDFNMLGRKFVIESGFGSCSSAQRGCHVVMPGQQIDPNELLLRRDHVVLDWPLEHILYFIARNASRASVENNSYAVLCESSY